MKDKIKLHIISFGNNPGYVRLSKDIVKRIQKRYPFSTYQVYTQDDLPADVKKICDQYSRGYGYWLWKPFIILDSLKNLDSETILFYVDGRTDFRSKSIDWLDEFSNIKDKSVAAWQMNHPEYMWTNSKIFEYFDQLHNKSTIESGQFAATFSVWRKSIDTLAIVEKWKEIMIINHTIVRDEFLGLDSYDFRENRHDQSVFSLLLKTTANIKCSIYNITDKQIYSRNSLIPHGKSHPYKFGLFIRYNFYYRFYVWLKYRFKK